MADVATISLHDAGQRLAELHGSKEQIACGKLLSLLKTGQVKAGFQFPAGQTVLWITIPAHYWATVSSDKILKLFDTPRVARRVGRSQFISVSFLKRC